MRHSPKGKTMTLNDVGALVNQWALRQTDNWGNETSPGAHPTMSYNLITPIAQYVLDNKLSVDAAGFETAYQAVIAAQPAPGPVTPPVMTGTHTLSEMSDDDWCYLIKFVEASGTNAGLVMQSLFSDPYAACQEAFDTFHNNNTAKVNLFDSSTYTGWLKSII